MIETINKGCGLTRCPKCQLGCPCVDHDAVDVGVGVVTDNHQWRCPTHGLFVFVGLEGVALFQEDYAPEGGS
jgi:hypothetical protein